MPFLAQLHDVGFARGRYIVCTYFDENLLSLVPAAHVEGLYGCLDYYQDVGDPFSKELLRQYDALYPGSAKFTGGSACSGLYRGLRFWEAAVKEAGCSGRKTSSRRSTMRGSPRGRVVLPKWCPGSTMCG